MNDKNFKRSLVITSHSAPLRVRTTVLKLAISTHLYVHLQHVNMIRLPLSPTLTMKFLVADSCTADCLPAWGWLEEITNFLAPLSPASREISPSGNPSTPYEAVISLKTIFSSTIHTTTPLPTVLFSFNLKAGFRFEEKKKTINTRFSNELSVNIELTLGR